MAPALGCSVSAFRRPGRHFRREKPLPASAWGYSDLPLSESAIQGAIRVALEIPPEDDILHHLAALPPEVSKAKHAWLLEHERELAVASRPAAGAVALVRGLHARGLRLGILTRNARELALLTLQAIGVDDCFAPADILGAS